MSFALIFIAETGRYSCHAEGCSAARDRPEKGYHRLQPQFASIAAAHAYADQDESEKAGQPAKAIWRECACTKGHTPTERKRQEAAQNAARLHIKRNTRAPK